MSSKTLLRVQRELEARERRGVCKYGTTVDREDLGAWQWLQHAKEEAMDLVMYLDRLQERIQTQDLLEARDLERSASRTSRRDSIRTDPSQRLAIRNPYGAGGSLRGTTRPTGISVWRKLLKLIVPASMPSFGGSSNRRTKRGGGR